QPASMSPHTTVYRLGCWSQCAVPGALCSVGRVHHRPSARLVLWPRDQGLAANTPAANHWLLADSQQPVAAPVQRACKPDSVPPSREAAVICLDAVSPRRSSSQPGSHNGPGTHPPLFGLAPGGVCLAALLPGRRCALT